MSLEATIWAWEQKLGRPSLKLVLLSLADRADQHNLCYPTLEKIADDTELNRKTVVAAIRDLEELGMLKRSSGGGRSVSNRYELVGPLHRDQRRAKTVTSTDFSLEPKTVTFTETGPKSTINRSKNGQKTGPKTDHEPISEPPIESPSNTYARAQDKKHNKISLENLPTEVSPETAKAYIDHRRAIKAPMTQYAFDRAMKNSLRAPEIGWTPDRLIDATIDRGWRGIEVDWHREKCAAKAKVEEPWEDPLPDLSYLGYTQ